MDSVTHILSAALWTEPVPPPRLPGGAVFERWRERFALVAAALLPDADGVLGWIDAELYARWHRVATHSLIGLSVVVLIAVFSARFWPRSWTPGVIKGQTQGAGRCVAPQWRRLLGVAALSAGMHVLGDLPTAWGGIQPFWPFSHLEISLGRVNSLEPRMLAFTVAAWAVQHLLLRKGRRRSAWAVSGCWLLGVVLYVCLRPFWGPPAFV